MPFLKFSCNPLQAPLNRWFKHTPESKPIYSDNLRFIDGQGFSRAVFLPLPFREGGPGGLGREVGTGGLGRDLLNPLVPSLRKYFMNESDCLRGLVCG